MQLLRYNVAMSLDGYIAREDGSYYWIPRDPGVDFPALYAQFDSFVLGRKTFELVQGLGPDNPTKDRSVLVVSKTLPDPGVPGVEILREAVIERIRAQKANAAKDVWLFVGAHLFRYLLDEGLVDRIEVSVIPILLSGGIPLIPEGRSQRLRLVSSEALSTGVVQLVYEPYA
jgi:dihydrofolate reductase